MSDISATLTALANAQAAAKAAGSRFAVDEIAQVIVKTNAGADLDGLLDVVSKVGRRVARSRGDHSDLWTRLLLGAVRSKHAATVTRRSAEQIAQDRQAILDHVAAKGQEEVRAAAWMRPQDVNALVKAGRLERTVRREYEAQNARDNLFGGVGQMVRKRAYLRVL